MYGIEIGFPVEPTKEDIKKLKRDLAHNKFGVVDSGTKGKPAGDRAGVDKAKSAGKKD